MQKVTIIGNLGTNPEIRITKSGLSVCSFSVAASKKTNGNDITTWFRVSAFGKLAENCARFLAKGRKVGVVGDITLNTYTAKDGSTKASLEVTAEDVEFLSPAGTGAENATVDAQAGFVKVDDEILPF